MADISKLAFTLQVKELWESYFWLWEISINNAPKVMNYTLKKYG